MTERAQNRIYKTCPWGVAKEGYQFALCNTKYCELWNEKGGCCSFIFLDYLADAYDLAIKILESRK